MTVTEFLKVTGPDPNIQYPECMQWMRPRAVCADGWSVSIQANNFAYCTPRRWDCDRYTDVELGFPLRMDPLIVEWAEDPGSPTETTYPFVPIYLVEKMVAAHGGIVGYRDIDTSKTTMFTDTCGPEGCG